MLDPKIYNADVRFAVWATERNHSCTVGSRPSWEPFSATSQHLLISPLPRSKCMHTLDPGEPSTSASFILSCHRLPFIADRPIHPCFCCTRVRTPFCWVTRVRTSRLTHILLQARARVCRAPHFHVRGWQQPTSQNNSTAPT